MIPLKNALFMSCLFSFCPTASWAYKFVLSGGPGVGKSVIIDNLKQYGFKVKPEGFATLYQEGLHDEGFWRQLQKNLVAKQQEFEAGPASLALTFFDRGMVDIPVFSQVFGHEIAREDMYIIEKAKYDLVFIIEPLPEAYYRQTDTRQEGYQESLGIHQALCNAYREYYRSQGKNPDDYIISVPAPLESELSDLQLESSILERTQFILEKIFEQGIFEPYIKLETKDFTRTITCLRKVIARCTLNMPMHN